MQKFVVGDSVEVISGKYQRKVGTVNAVMGSFDDPEKGKTLAYSVALNVSDDPNTVAFQDHDFSKDSLKKLNKNIGIHEYPDRKLYLFDIIKLMDGHDEVILLDEDCSEEMYNGRVEYLTVTEDGVAHDLCDRGVRYIEGTKDGKILISLTNFAYQLE